MEEVDYRQLSDTSLVMPNGLSLNVHRFTVNNQPWVIYPGKTPSDKGTKLYVGTDGTNYQFYTYGAEDGYRLYPYHPTQGSPEDEKNLSKSLEIYTRAYGNDKPKKQFGGTMNYTSYLQGGGTTPQSTSQQISKDEIKKIITAALLGTGKIKQQASEMLQSMLQDSSIAPLVEQVMEEMGVPMQKCGGRVKKKACDSKIVKTQTEKCGGAIDKKACGSKLVKTPEEKCGGKVKKKEFGSKITPNKVMAKGGCSCLIKKVGGKLIEVDSCTGLPIRK